MSGFKVGDRVVCRDASDWGGILRLGEHYTVSQVQGHGAAIRLKEIANVVAGQPYDDWFYKNRFKLAEEQNTPIPQEDILAEAYRLTSGDRNAQYGPPDQDFARTAGLWTALFAHKLKDGEKFETWEVAQAMICLKLSRLQHSRKRDNVVDGAGYFRCMDTCYKAKGGYES